MVRHHREFFETLSHLTARCRNVWHKFYFDLFDSDFTKSTTFRHRPSPDCGSLSAVRIYVIPQNKGRDWGMGNPENIFSPQIPDVGVRIMYSYPLAVFLQLPISTPELSVDAVVELVVHKNGLWDRSGRWGIECGGVRVGYIFRSSKITNQILKSLPRAVYFRGASGKSNTRPSFISGRQSVVSIKVGRSSIPGKLSYFSQIPHKLPIFRSHSLR